MPHFPHGPNIDVHFWIDHHHMQRVELFPHTRDGLMCTIHSTQSGAALELEILQWLIAYLDKKPISLALPLQWETIKPFTAQVLHHLQSIPFAKSVSYGQLALIMQRPTAARAVGQACGRNPFPLLIPCHRVLGANQAIGGFSAGGIEVKRRLLAFENSLVNT
jgi:methylated-DNA-[protein]-cysteine S-methyltransferase